MRSVCWFHGQCFIAVDAQNVCFVLAYLIVFVNTKHDAILMVVFSHRRTPFHVVRRLSGVKISIFLILNHTFPQFILDFLHQTDFKNTFSVKFLRTHEIQDRACKNRASDHSISRPSEFSVLSWTHTRPERWRGTPSRPVPERFLRIR